MKVYLDCCCINRPFDRTDEGRVALEAEAVRHILRLADDGAIELVVSDALLFELRRMPDDERREACLAVAATATRHVRVSSTTGDVVARLAVGGIVGLDGLHLALAVEGGVDALLTVDDRLLRRGRALAPALGLVVADPVEWILGHTDRRLAP